MVELERETLRQTHPPDQAEIDEMLKDAYRQPPRDCTACHTKRTRPCPCGNRIHNEMQGGVFVEQCFGCGTGWVPA